MRGLIDMVEKIRVGNPLDPHVEMGPVMSEAQLKKVLQYIESGKDQGARLACGGERLNKGEYAKGYYVQPTIFDDVSPTMRIAQEEIFGPVLSVLKFKREEEAVAMANDSIYGLGGGVWSRDEEKAMSVAKRLRAGTVWINEWHLLSEKAPFGGYKQSGIGREFGVEGLREYTETKHLHIDEIGAREKKFWYDTVVPKS